MKAVFFSDIHGITTNLDKIENVINKLNPDYVVALGDLYGSDYSSNEYIYNFLMSFEILPFPLVYNYHPQNESFLSPQQFPDPIL